MDVCSFFVFKEMITMMFILWREAIDKGCGDEFDLCDYILYIRKSNKKQKKTNN